MVWEDLQHVDGGLQVGYTKFGPKWWNGRRRGLKILRREACRFESDLGHHLDVNAVQ